jgi:hypothetical protein
MEDVIEETLRREPLFILRSIQILSKFRTFISVHEFEAEYIDTFDLYTSPLFHCSKLEKAKVLSILPYVKIQQVIEDNIFLGETTISLAQINL